MHTIDDLKPGELSPQDMERIIEQAHRMRSQALADIGTALWSVVRRSIHWAYLHLCTAVRGHSKEKCA